MNAPDIRFFSDSYLTGRTRWLELLNKLACPIRYQPYQAPGFGPNNEALITDTAWLGADEAERVLVIISGTHGVEGFAGNAVQLNWLTKLANSVITLPKATAVLIVHALTPWGYAWRRRCDHDGVDLNRNKVDFNQALPQNPGYEELRSALYHASHEQRQQLFNDYEQQQGRAAFEHAISAGQYTDALGPFYGGLAPAHGRLVIEDLIQQYQLAHKTLAVVDIHTGLGPFGYGEIICDHEPDSLGANTAKHWYGDSVTLPLLGTSFSVPKYGLMDFAWHEIMADSESCCITLEFGTYRTRELFEILLKDHLLWAMTDNDDARAQHAQVMQNYFCPQDRAWRELVLFRSQQVLDQALTGVAG